MSIEVLGFDGCPNTQPLLDNVQRAANTLRVAVNVRYVNQEQLAHDDMRRGWPAPTVLVNGKDLFGMEPPTSPAMGCRMYPGGTPSEAAVTAALQVLLSK
ncbi:MAG TPA: hypothetical protein PK400_13350 [Phycisphaerales bacterium]|nr:hypothetical protein [Phycisphaerales bacterium]HRQ75095.1 hypothetical protein [Phycisphaerales bacterium]